jgi:hypothetical protein
VFELHEVDRSEVKRFLASTTGATFTPTQTLSDDIKERFIALCVRVLANPLHAFDHAEKQHKIAAAVRSLTALSLTKPAPVVTATILDHEPSVSPVQLSSLIATAVKKEMATFRSTHGCLDKQINNKAQDEKRVSHHPPSPSNPTNDSQLPPRLVEKEIGSCLPFGRSRTSTGRPRSRRSRQRAYARNPYPPLVAPDPDRNPALPRQTTRGSVTK